METTNGFFEAVALWSQVLGAVVFLIVVILLFRKYLIPAVEANEKARNAEIADAEARRERVRAEAAAARGEVESAQRDAAEIRARVDMVVKREHDHLVAEARADGERMVRNAEGELERARMAARDRLRIELIEKALLQARSQAAGRVDERTNARLVNETVDDLSRGKN
jgi:F-type H+-transporting ATPase subunit b